MQVNLCDLQSDRGYSRSHRNSYSSLHVHGRNYVEANASYRNWRFFFFLYKDFILKIWNLNLYSDRNDIHWMNSFNVYGYHLNSTDIVAMKDITDFKDIRHLTGLSNTWWFKAYSILFTCFNLSQVFALMQCILSFSVMMALKSCL
jgi:hypothetical protein